MHRQYTNIDSFLSIQTIRKRRRHRLSCNQLHPLAALYATHNIKEYTNASQKSPGQNIPHQSAANWQPLTCHRVLKFEVYEQAPTWNHAAVRLLAWAARAAACWMLLSWSAQRVGHIGSHLKNNRMALDGIGSSKSSLTHQLHVIAHWAHHAWPLSRKLACQPLWPNCSLTSNHRNK